MKKCFLIILILCLCSAILPAQKKDSIYWRKTPFIRWDILKSNPFAILWGPMVQTSEFRLVYETPVTVTQSGSLGLSYLGKGPFFVTLIDITDTNQNPQKHAEVVQLAREAIVSGFRWQGLYKFYLLKNKEAPSGVYGGPHISYSTYKMTFKRYPGFYEKRTHVNFNVLFGYQGIIAQTMVIDLFVGFGLKDNFYEYRLTNNSLPVRENEESILGDTKISIGFNIGFVNFKLGRKMLHP